MIHINLKTKMSIAVSMLVVALMAGLAGLIITHFQGHFKESISRQQFALISEMAWNIDKSVLQAQKMIVARAASFPEQWVNNPSQAQHELDETGDLTNIFDNGIFLFSSSGAMLAEYPDGHRQGTSFAYREYFRKTMASGKSQISAPYLSSQKHHHPSIMFTAPVLSADGTIIAVLGGSIDLMGDNLFGRYAQMKIGKTGYVYLYSADRTLIIHPDKSRIMTKGETPGSNRVFDKGIAGFDGTEENVNSRGLRALTTVKHLNSVDWILGANYPLTDAFAPVLETTRYSIIATIIGILCSVLIVWMLLRFLTQPLIKLTAHIKRISEHDGEVKEIQISSGDEMEELARSFNNTMSSLDKEQKKQLELSESLMKSLVDTEQEKNRTEAFIAAIGQMVSVQDTEFRIIYQNKVIQQKMGAHVGEYCYRAYHNKDAICEGCHLVNAFRDGQIHSFENESIQADGKLLYLEFTVSPVRDASGKVVAVVELVHNVTEQKNMELMLKAAMQAADFANKAKSEFLASMSHEIRTPMNGVIGMTSLLLTTKLDQMQREYAEIISTSGKNLLSLINDILDLSKIEAHKIELESRLFDFQAVVSETVSLLSYQAAEKGLMLKVWFDADAPKLLKGDALRLRQVITNLVGNALKFTPSGSVHLLIWKEDEDELKYTIRINVCDSGIGIPSDKLEQIFEPFTQADGSTTRKYGGSGLGLAISQQLIEMMGGRLRVDSAEGKGSVFSFTIDMEKPTEIGSKASETIAEFANQTEQISGHADSRLLLAEDDPVNQKVAKAFLTQLGYHVDIFSNGTMAVEALKTGDYDLVLMDCMMPLMGGFEATAIIRDPSSTVRNHGIPVIALTASALNDDREKCIAAGMDDYLSKPIDLNELQGVLNKWLAPDKPEVSGGSNGYARTEDEYKNDFDLEQFVKRNLNDRELSRDVAVIFLDNAPDYINSIRIAIESSNANDIRHHAHRLKGSAANISLKNLCETAGMIEAIAAKGETGNASQYLPELEHRFERAAEALRSQLDLLQSEVIE